MKVDIEKCAKQLLKFGFDVQIVATIEDASTLLSDEIERCKPKSISYGDSITVRATNVIDKLRSQNEIKFYDGFDASLAREERLKVRRSGLMCDFYFTGVNAISAKGSLHWLDMIGNRIAPIAFGPSRVVILGGVNKIVKSAKKAEKRIRKIAAPLNIARHPDFKTPCAKTGKCSNCNSPQRICNSHLIVDRCFPKKRILVILIEQNLGL